MPFVFLPSNDGKISFRSDEGIIIRGDFLSRFYHSNPIFTPASHSETAPRNEQIIENKWRKRVGVEPTGDGVTRRPPVLKTGTITGPHALPWKLFRFRGNGFPRTESSLTRARVPSESRATRESTKNQSTAANLFRLRHDSQIRLRRLPPSGILFLRFFIRHVAADDDVVARLPVRRR